MFLKNSKFHNVIFVPSPIHIMSPSPLKKENGKVAKFLKLCKKLENSDFTESKKCDIFGKFLKHWDREEKYHH